MNILRNLRIWGNEVCPCGSGKQYKFCCKNKKGDYPQASKKPPEIQIMEMMHKSLKKRCMHPDQEKCKGKIKNAHALQNNKIISLLAGDERHVYMLAPKKKTTLINVNGNPEVMVEISKTSANNATTETCFCDLHDNIAFAVIEKGAPNFEETNEEMKFVYAYKAFIFEYYKQYVSLDAFKTLFKANAKLLSTPKMVLQYRSLQIKMKEFESIKAYFDEQILSKSHEGLITCIIKIPEKIEFALYAYIAPDYDLNGKKIRYVVKGQVHRLAITVLPEETQSYILLSCLESEHHIYKSLFDQVENSSLDKVKFYMNLFLPLYSENMVLSSALWRSWDSKVQNAYTVYANVKEPEFSVYNKAVSMMLKNAARKKNEFDYSERPIMDLFPLQI